MKQRLLDLAESWYKKLVPFPRVHIKWSRAIGSPHCHWHADLTYREFESTTKWVEIYFRSENKTYVIARTSTFRPLLEARSHNDRIIAKELSDVIVYEQAVDKLIDEGLFSVPQFTEVIEFLPRLFGLHEIGCRCKVLQRLDYAYGYGWMMDNDLVYWCPRCGNNLPTEKNLGDPIKLSRFERLII